MSTVRPADDAAVREQAYYIWEAEGRPDGRESEFWLRASTALAEKPAPKTKAAGKPKAVAKPKVVAKPKPATKPKAAAKPVPKLKAAASKTKAAPVKTGPAKKPKKK